MASLYKADCSGKNIMVGGVLKEEDRRMDKTVQICHLLW